MIETKTTKGQIGTKISEAIVSFEKIHLGRGPSEIKTYIISDMVLVRFKGIITPAEKQLCATIGGATLVKRTQTQLLKSARAMLEDIILDITGCKVRSLHLDLSTKIDEKIIIFVLDKNLEHTISSPLK